MSQLERLYKIEKILNNKQAVSFEYMLALLEVSPATLKRDLSYLRDRMNLPVIYDRFEKGYRIEEEEIAKKYGLPGLWFSANEIKALLSMRKLLLDLDAGGLLEPHIEPLLERIKLIMTTEAINSEAILKRIKILTANSRRNFNAKNFELISSTLLIEKQLKITYRSRYKNSVEDRNVSPQRMIFYRENWYLAAYCHARMALRIFSLDAIENIEITGATSLQISDDELNKKLDSGYGIYNGAELQWAVIEFDSESARWAQNERWHPNQEIHNFLDGKIHIKIPYLDSTGLVTDILRWSYHAKVLEPDTLKEQIKIHLKKTLEQY